MKQKIGTAFLSLIILISFSDTASASARESLFVDMSLNSQFYEAVYSMNAKKVMRESLTPKGSFIAPTRTITRADAAVMLYRLLGLEYEQGLTYPDVTSKHRAYEAIHTLSAQGVLQGFIDGTFRPNQQLTRAEMSKIIALAFEYEITSEAKIPFIDVSSTFKAYVNALYVNKITSGVSANQFDPNRHITRQEMAAFMNRAYQKVSISDYNDVEIEQSLSEVIRKVQWLNMQGVERNYPNLQSKDILVDMKDLAEEPFLSQSISNYINYYCENCATVPAIRYVDFNLPYTIKITSETSFEVNGIVPDGFIGKGYRAHIILTKVKDIWKIKSFSTTSFEDAPLNMTIADAKVYIKKYIDLNSVNDYPIYKIEHIGKFEDIAYDKFRINNEYLYVMNLNTGYLTFYPE